MKTFFVILLMFFILLLNIQANAQKKETVELFTIYPGYIITNFNDTVNGYLLLKNKIANQGKVFFFDSPDAKEPSGKYKPKDIKAYMVAGRFYETMKYSPEYTTMRYSFLLRVIDGPVCLYKAYYDDKERIKIDEKDIWNSKIDLSFSEGELKDQNLGGRQGEEIQFFDSMSYLLKFKKTMSKYLSDCPEIANKIANKEEGYQWINLEKIILEYNEWYLKNH